MSTIKVTRELDGKNNTGVIGELLTIGTENVAEANKYFAMTKFSVTGLLSENNQALATDAVISSPLGQAGQILCADDMYVAGDPLVGGKGNNYKAEVINPPPGFYTMFQDGKGNGASITVNAHVEKINPEGNTAFTEYGFLVKNEDGQKTQAVLSGGQMTIIDANGQSKKLLPPNDVYYVGNPMDPTAKFYYADVPGAGKDGAAEKRLMVDYYEKPSQGTKNHLVAQGADPTEVANMRAKTTLSYGFRVPDGVDTYALPEGVGAGSALKVAANGVKTYYDSHYNEGNCSVLQVRLGAPPPPPPPSPVPPTPPSPPTPVPPTPPSPPYPSPPVPPTPPPPSSTVVAANERAGIWGSSHIDEADGGKYNFQQTGIFSVLKDKGVILNAKTESPAAGVSYITEAGLTVGSRTVQLFADGNVFLGFTDPNVVTGSIQLQNGQTVALDNGASITRTGDKVILETSEYKVQFDLLQSYSSSKKYMDIDIWSKAGGVLTDGVAPSGLLGETFDEGKVQQTATKLNADAYRQANLIDRSGISASVPTPTPATAPAPAPAPVPVLTPAPPPPASIPNTTGGNLNKLFQLFMSWLQKIVTGG